jgi:hypothetical protein
MRVMGKMSEEELSQFQMIKVERRKPWQCSHARLCLHCLLWRSKETAHHCSLQPSTSPPTYSSPLAKKHPPLCVCRSILTYCLRYSLLGRVDFCIGAILSLTPTSSTHLGQKAVVRCTLSVFSSIRVACCRRDKERMRVQSHQ